MPAYGRHVEPPRVMYVLMFRGVPIHVSRLRERLVEQMSRYTPAQQTALWISDPVEVLR